MKFIKITVVLISLFVFASGANAQETQNKSDKEQLIKAQKIAFFTEKIGLTPAEAEKFWPVYNDYWATKNKIIAERKDKMTYFSQNSDKMSQAEMIKYANQYIDYETQLAELLNEYHSKFKMILPIEKVMKIYLADYEFKTYLLQKIKDSGKDE
ncbi:MAG: hypothetical protein A2X13_03735 [Bacteroidetes bacterium GWC2_33_15]|nr:MAG: hypothetical protein A2X10_13350 [Bacteroidetes bacterium GWA2_33_15]OFX51716.1 MAG: hypothetical protein A2X13_03735 [Bacteroidetes bacterium GWC2_33_15]OFX66224.1 MAG: hypothetical protein A2X15_14210 [Bacteroidetes bacterium GWB2_32_14]OFX67016.1 MAG: hypothetical protein A2X14_00895 [Bacteroidetes bacterium GWD2_33_33]HAN17719.1 hypothetical protein [Bacteroidales bacterium]